MPSNALSWLAYEVRPSSLSFCPRTCRPDSELSVDLLRVCFCSLSNSSSARSLKTPHRKRSALPVPFLPHPIRSSHRNPIPRSTQTERIISRGSARLPFGAQSALSTPQPSSVRFSTHSFTSLCFCLSLPPIRSSLPLSLFFHRLPHSLTSLLKGAFGPAFLCISPLRPEPKRDWLSNAKSNISLMYLCRPSKRTLGP